jgi:hypothetical protein
MSTSGILFTIIVLVSMCINAEDLEFTSHTVADGGYIAPAVRVLPVDLDMDSDEDIISVSDVGYIIWYENRGMQGYYGHLIGKTAAADYRGPRAIKALDMDSDGDLDIVTTASIREGSIGRITGDLRWYENDGKQIYTAHLVEDTTIDGAWQLDAADMDGDSDIDFVLAAKADLLNKLVLFENTGLNSFLSHTVSLTGNYYWVITADMDNDGDLDIVAANENNYSYVCWFDNDGNGNLNEKPTVIDSSRDATNEYLWISPVDAGHDGDIDIVSVAEDRISLHENNGNGNFVTVVVDSGLSVQNECAGKDMANACDLDNDGDYDIVCGTCITPGELIWYRNDGGNIFSKVVIVSTEKMRAVTTADMDQDGDLDILSTGERVTIYENDGSQNFTPRPIGLYYDNARYSLSTGDVDGDGYTDVVVGADKDGMVRWYRGNANEGFSLHIVDSTLCGDPLVNVEVADINGNGNGDIILADPVSDSVVYYTFDASDEFVRHAISGTRSSLWRYRLIEVADLNNDGYSDLISCTRDGHLSYYIDWYENDGVGAFTSHPVDSQRNVTSVNTADLNDDGNLDIIRTSAYYVDPQGELDSWKGAISWYESEGNGKFSGSKWILLEPTVSSAFADFDSDGDIDIVATHVGYRYTIEYFENDGTGSYNSRGVTKYDDCSFTIDHTSCLDAADLDGDNDTDVLIASTTGIFWLDNDGEGNFTQRQIGESELNRAQTVHAEDLNNDGRIDVIAADPEAEKVVWFENLTGNSVKWQASTYRYGNNVELQTCAGSGIMRLNVSVPQKASIAVETYNLDGALVATPLQRRITTDENSYTVGMTSSQGRMLSTGMYICKVRLDGTYVLSERIPILK